MEKFSKQHPPGFGLVFRLLRFPSILPDRVPCQSSDFELLLPTDVALDFFASAGTLGHFNLTFPNPLNALPRLDLLVDSLDLRNIFALALSPRFCKFPQMIRLKGGSWVRYASHRFRICCSAASSLCLFNSISTPGFAVTEKPTEGQISGTNYADRFVIGFANNYLGVERNPLIVVMKQEH